MILTLWLNNSSKPYAFATSIPSILSNAISASSSYFPRLFLANSFIFSAILLLKNIAIGKITNIPPNIIQFILIIAILNAKIITAYCKISGNISDKSLPISLISDVSLFIIAPAFFSKKQYCAFPSDSIVIFLHSFWILILKHSLQTLLKKDTTIAIIIISPVFVIKLTTSTVSPSSIRFIALDIKSEPCTISSDSTNKNSVDNRNK